MKDIIQGIKNKTAHLKNPGALFGLLYPYILVMVLAIGIFYVNNLDKVTRQSVPAVILDSTVVADIPVKNSVIVPPLNISEVKNSTPDLLAEGEKLYKANCSSCHGENGAGGGPASMGLNPAPRNFTSRDNWKNGTKLSQIYTTLQEGLLPSAMAAYDYLLPKEKFALGHYIRTNFIPEPEADSDADLSGLDATYNLSAGLQLPAQIPVVQASSIVVTENSGKIDKLNSVLSSITNYSNDAGYLVFNKCIKNDKTALSFLINNQSWKSNENQFVNLIVNNVNQNGFNGRVFNLSGTEWSSLYNFLTRVI
jgi:mono/diheme cytochrome c family protein